MLGVVENMDLGALQHPAEIYVGILAATILFIATNAGLIGVSRLTYSMGQHRQLPELLRALHPKFRTPYVAIIVFGLVACVAILPGQADFLGVDLRVRGDALVHDRAPRADQRCASASPSVERPWRGPGDDPRAGRTTCPLLAVFGGLGTGIALIVVTVLDVRVARLGAALAALGIVELRRLPAPAGAVADRDAQDRRRPKPAVEHEVEYQSVLVAFEDGQFSPEAVATAVRLAAIGAGAASTCS